MSFVDALKRHIRKSDNWVLSKSYIRGDHSRLRFNYSNMVEVVADTVDWCKRLGSDYDTVIAIPRSGMVVGSVIATSLGKPLSTPEMFVRGHRWAYSHSKEIDDIYRSALLVDDSLATGNQLSRNEWVIRESCPDVKLIKAVLYCSKNHTRHVDRFYKEISTDDYNQWEFNQLHSSSKPLACDMDGVLCEDNPKNATEEEFEQWAITARPYKIPLYEIDCIVTAREEKYRWLTEKWLKEHNVKYKRLYMAGVNDVDVVTFKSGVLLKEKPFTYWESDEWLSEQLYRRTGIPVVCTGNGRKYG